MRVRIGVRGFAVSCPACVGDADVAPQRFALDPLYQLTHLAGGFMHFDCFSVRGKQRDTRRIVAAIFQSFQSFQEDLGDISFSNCADNSAHGSDLLAVSEGYKLSPRFRWPTISATGGYRLVLALWVQIPYYSVLHRKTTTAIMAAQKRYFGTDGIRGKVGQTPITPDFMLKLGWAAGKVFTQGGNRSKILIGKDTRISGYMFEAALEAGLTAAGVDINLTGPMPTPAIAYLTRTLRAQAGIVISASHNSFEDNGIKFFSDNGTKLPDEIELAIEAELSKALTTVAPKFLGKASRIDDARGHYIEFCKSTVGSRLTLSGLKVVVDCANGATYDIAPAVLSELGADVVSIGTDPNGLNINDKIGSTSPAALKEKVLEVGAALGVALDGDGDRSIMVDHEGNVVDGDEMLFVIACERRRRNIEFGGVVGTKMSNLGMELALAELEVPFARTAVGDRFVLQEMLQRGWQLGGESSGHIICHDITTTGDGIVSALQALTAVALTDKPLMELRSAMQKFPQTMINVRLGQNPNVSASQSVRDAVSGVEAKLQGRGRVLLRPSGTEPVLRVMVEGEDADLVAQLAQELADVVAAEAEEFA